MVHDPKKCHLQYREILFKDIPCAELGTEICRSCPTVVVRRDCQDVPLIPSQSSGYVSLDSPSSSKPQKPKSHT